MQIAEELQKDGVSGSSAFCDKLSEIVSEFGITRVVETGTHMGLGTTRAILNGMNGRAFTFYSIEVNPSFYTQAKANLGAVPGLYLLNGLSVNRSLIPIDTTFNVPDHVVVDHFPEHRNIMYRREVSFNVPDNLLNAALREFNYRPELVVLDSAGHMGWIEFCYLLDLVEGDFILALDDTCHVKHYDSMEFIRNNPKRFEILWEVESEYLNATSGSKFGSAIIKVNDTQL